jgi:hypothetical protein
VNRSDALLARGAPISIESLMDEGALSLDAAIESVRDLAKVEPFLDVYLFRGMFSKYGGGARAIEPAAALRVLRLVDGISDCSRLTSYLVQLLSHPNLQVRSKVVLLLGRANLNLDRIQTFLASPDGRVRANAVEALWGHREHRVRAVLWQTAKDPYGRVAVNALVGLCKLGDREAFSRLEQLAGSPDAGVRSGAAWGMGETGEPEFSRVLNKLALDLDPKVKAMAEKGLKQLRVPPQEPAVVGQPAEKISE